MPDTHPAPAFYFVTFALLVVCFVIGSISMTVEQWRAAFKRPAPVPVPSRRVDAVAWRVERVPVKSPAPAVLPFDGPLAEWLRELPLCPACPAPLMALPETGETMVLWPCPQHFAAFVRARGGHLPRALVERQLSPLVVHEYTHHHS